VTVEAVMAVMQRNVASAQAVIAAAIPQFAHERGCRCGQALHNAIMTAPEHIPADARERLGLILDKYPHAPSE
jgi:5'-methylthioadenosine phosphorylase